MFGLTTVLGLDPGVASTGYGVVTRAGSQLSLSEAGVLDTPAGLNLPARLLQIYLGVGELIGRFQPDAISVERVLFSANARTAMAVGQGSGVVLLAAAESGVPVELYSPNEVKLAVAGYGGAPKPQVGRMVAALLSLPAPPRPDDAADACALAICHLHAAALRSRVREAGG
jgi:crossover junction endodeoxyribonuclease RuvC